METESILAGVLAFLLLIRPYVAAPQSVTTVIGGCVAVAVVVAGDRGLLDKNKPVWIVVMMLGFLFFYGIRERVENWLNRRHMAH